MTEKGVPSLHDVALGISMSLETQAISHDRGGRAGIMHVSGTPFLKCRTQARAEYLGDTISSLCPFELCRVGRRLECAWNVVLGQGGYAQVFYGQVLPFRVEVVGHMILVWRAMRPLLAPLVQASSLLAYSPLQNLTLASHECAALVWQMMIKTAEIWGVARPCAVKVLLDRSPNKGAYGSRSVEHEVLITMHVSSTCASCPFIGKAHGFDLADNARPLIHSPSCACPCSATTCPNPACTNADAVLLVLEAYTVDLTSLIRLHKQHSPECNEFPCSRCLHILQHDDSYSCKTLTVRAASAAAAPLQALAAPINAATATACMFASAVTSSQSKEKAHSTAGGRQLDSPKGQVVSLWEYAIRLRESGLVMNISEVLRIARELAEAVHTLHTVAHVMHLDIKPQNVLLDSQLHVKLLDFGLSAAFKPERAFIILLSKGRGTRPYTAPELLAGSPGTVSPAADIYSLGCCLAAVCSQSRCTSSGEPPDIFGLLKKGVCRNTDLSAYAPQELHSLLKACLREHAFERPSSGEVLEQLMTMSSEHRRSLELPQQLQLCSSEASSISAALKTAAPPVSPQKGLLQPLQSFPFLQALTAIAALPRNLHISDSAEHGQRQTSPAFPVSRAACEPSMRHMHGTRSFSLAGGNSLHGSAACMAAMCDSKSSTQILASPRLCSNMVADSSSISQAGMSSVWSGVWASDVQRGVPVQTSEAACNGGLLGDGCRTSMPYTTSVRFGLASVMRPLSAHSSSVSGWLSEGSGSISFASHATAY